MDQSSENKTEPHSSPLWDNVIETQGVVIAGGVSGLVQLSKFGYAVKSPWPGPEYPICCADLALEAEIYKLLGRHKRLVRVVSWDPSRFMLTMEYMSNGNLQDFLEQHHDAGISLEQRVQWALETAEGLQLLHSADVIHCDVKAKNLLLDSSLQIKIADFGSSSLRGSKPTGSAGSRYMPPGDIHAFGVHVDLFALGCTIYKIMTGHDPYGDLPSDEVPPLYCAHRFPSVASLPCGEVIQKCWLGEVRSAGEVHGMIAAISSGNSRTG